MPFHRFKIQILILNDLYQQLIVIFARNQFKTVSKISNLHIIQAINMWREVCVYFAFCEIGYCILDKIFGHLTYK
ncbi:hypothetical protein M2418_003886 [Rhizobium sp. BIGb0125]|jgi:hypothetical protein|nr:hypothetical protein [Rhizobium sp. BIGb0125]